MNNQHENKNQTQQLNQLNSITTNNSEATTLNSDLKFSHLYPDQKSIIHHYQTLSIHNDPNKIQQQQVIVDAILSDNNLSQTFDQELENVRIQLDHQESSLATDIQQLESIKQGGQGSISLCYDKNINKILIFKQFNSLQDYKRELSFLKLIQNTNNSNQLQITPKIHNWFQDSMIIITERGACSLQQYSNYLIKQNNFQWKEEQLLYITYRLIKLSNKLYEKFNIFHADIKPDNIILDTKDVNLYQVKFIDFGGSCQLPQNYGKIHTKLFFDPQIKNMILDGQINSLSDINCIQAELYSIGMTILYIMRYHKLFNYLDNRITKSINENQILNIQQQFANDQKIQEQYPILHDILKYCFRLQNQNNMKIEYFKQILDLFTDKNNNIVLQKYPEIPDQHGFQDEYNAIKNIQSDLIIKQLNRQNSHKKIEVLEEDLKFNIGIREYKRALVILDLIDDIRDHEQSKENNITYVFQKVSVLFENHLFENCFKFLINQKYITLDDHDYYKIIYWIGKCTMKQYFMIQDCQHYLIQIKDQISKIDLKVQQEKYHQRAILEIEILEGKLNNLFGRFSEAMTQFDNIKEKYTQNGIFNDFYLIRNFNHRAKTFYVQKNTLKAQQSLKQALQIIEKYKKNQNLSHSIFPEQVDKLQATQYKLMANTYRYMKISKEKKQKSFEKSIQLIETATQLYQEYYGKDTEYLLECKIIHARILKFNQYFKKSIQILQQVNTSSIQLGNMVQQASSQYAIAEIHVCYKEYDKAIQLLEQILKYCENQKLSKNHHHSLSSQYMLGICYEYTHKYEQAYKMLNHVKQTNDQIYDRSIQVNQIKLINKLIECWQQFNKESNIFEPISELPTWQTEQILNNIDKNEFMNYYSEKIDFLQNYMMYLTQKDSQYEKLFSYIIFYQNNKDKTIKKQSVFLSTLKNKIFSQITSYFQQAEQKVLNLQNKFNGFSCLQAFRLLKKCLQYKQKLENIDLERLYYISLKPNYDLTEEEQSYSFKKLSFIHAQEFNQSKNTVTYIQILQLLVSVLQYAKDNSNKIFNHQEYQQYNNYINTLQQY